MFAHFNGLTLAALIIVPGLVALGFAVYANHGITRRYTVRRGDRIVSRHWTFASATRAMVNYAAHSDGSGAYSIMGR